MHVEPAPFIPGRDGPEPAHPPMRVLLVVGSLEHGGAERHTICLHNRLGERGHECHVAYVKNRRDQIDRVMLRDGAVLQCLDARRFFDSGAVTRLSDMISGIGPDVVVAANEYALIYATLALRRSRARAAMIVTYHATELLNLKEYLKMLACLPLFWRADCAVFVCNSQRRRWLRRGVFSRRNVVIYNGVDTVEFSVGPAGIEQDRARSRLGFAGDDYVIGTAAALRPEKNHLQLIDAVARLRERNIPARAILVGDGEMRSAIERRARERGVASWVTITGFQSDVRPFVTACDVVAICSLTEAFSLAAIEAMALRKPVVHSSVGGAAEMIVPGWNGFLYPVANLGEFVRMLAVLSDRSVSRRLGHNARATAEKWFSERSMIDRYERLLLELAGASCPA